jgi:lipoprotein signal peptidase
MAHTLATRLARVAPIALAAAAVDWALKAWALAALRPDQLVFNTEAPWHDVAISAVLAVGLVAVAVTPLLTAAAGLIVGGGLGNLGELHALGRVTDFVPLGLPYRGSVWSPADFMLVTGLVLLWVGVMRARAQAPPAPVPG